MKVVIAGTRYKDPANKIVFDDFGLVHRTILASPFIITEVVSGQAVGVDLLGEQFAETMNIPVKPMPVTPAEWVKLGKKAGPMRNRRMAEYAEAAIIIWDGHSPGTRNMINEMIRLGKPYHVGLTYNNVEDYM